MASFVVGSNTLVLDATVSVNTIRFLGNGTNTILTTVDVTSALSTFDSLSPARIEIGSEITSIENDAFFGKEKFISEICFLPNSRLIQLSVETTLLEVPQPMNLEA
jgi:hypothetical protein